MIKVLFTTLFTLAGIFTSFAQAQVIPLTIDSSQSSVQISIGGSPSRSQLSGNMTFDIQSSNPPAGSAQITGLDLVVDEALSFSFLIVTASTSPGDVTLSLVTPGTPGVIAGNTFDQLDNLFALGGDLNTFQFFGGSETVDLATIDLGPADLDSVNVTQSGNIITISQSLTLTETLDLGALSVPVEIQATYVATGVAPVSVLLGDVNLNGAVTFGDIGPFIALLQSGGFQAEADTDLSGMVDFSDIAPFIAILMGQ